MAEIWADVGLVSWIQRVVWRIESEFGNKNKPTSEISPNSLLFSLFGHSFLGLIHRSSHFRSFAQSFSRFGNLISELHWFIQFFNQIYAFWYWFQSNFELKSNKAAMNPTSERRLMKFDEMELAKKEWLLLEQSTCGKSISMNESHERKRITD